MREQSSELVKMPRPLRPGDKVAIVSPASAVKGEYIDGAVTALEARGYRAVVGEHARGRRGSFSGTAAERADDMLRALTDPEVRAVVCSRGGYGCVHLLPELQEHWHRWADDPKWLVGFSDVTALHALWHRHGVASVHSSMAKELANGADTPANVALFQILEGKGGEVAWQPTIFDHPGEVTAPLAGGNLAVLDGLAGTPYFPAGEGDILLIEDIAEPIYKVERILWQLRLSGLLDRLGGLVVGRFTDYRPSSDWACMEEMIASMTRDCHFPRAFGAPFGHIDSLNLPLLLSTPARLSVSPSGTLLTFPA